MISIAAAITLFVGVTFGTDILHYRFIVVDGTHTIRASDIEAIVRSSMETKFLGIFRRNSFLFFSSRMAEQAVRSSLEADSRFENAAVTKEAPFLLRVRITERIPNIVYSNGGQEYLVDRKGLVTAFVSEPSMKKKEYPTVLDQTTGLFSVGERAMSTLVVDFLFALRDQLQASAIPADVYFLPPATCLNIADSLELPLETIGRPPTNTADTTGKTNTNGVALNANAASATNTSTQETDRDQGDASRGVVSLDQSCDQRPTVLQSRELRVKTTEGWELYFRVTDDAKTQVARVMRVLREQRLDRAALHYIDLRFGDRVIYK